MVRPGGDAGPTFPEVPMLGSDYPKIHAQHIEVPVRRFLCEYHHAAYRPDGFPFAFPAETRRERVLAESAEGTLAIARYHHFRRGSDFHILEGAAT
jgi:hypothetical protein